MHISVREIQYVWHFIALSSKIKKRFMIGKRGVGGALVGCGRLLPGRVYCTILSLIPRLTVFIRKRRLASTKIKQTARIFGTGKNLTSHHNSAPS